MNLADNKDQERRRFLRHPMCFPLIFSPIKDPLRKKSKSKKSETKNVSRSGLLFSAKEKVEPGILIQIKIPFQSKIFKVRANVVHCQKNYDTGLYDIGVRFSRPKEAFKLKLIEQMYLISEYRDLQSMQSGRDLSLQEASQEWVKKYSERFSRLYW